MKTVFLLLLLACATCITVQAAVPEYQQIIVKFHDDVTYQEASDWIAKQGDLLVGTDAVLGFYKVKVGNKASVSEQIEAYRAHPSVKYAEPDFELNTMYTPNDPYLEDQWHIPRMYVDMAWDMEQGKSQVIIAVVDTGVDADHKDLSAKLVSGYNSISNSKYTNDDDGHGTHVAGIAAAMTNNGIGGAGVCMQCKIMPIKALNSKGTGLTSDIAEGIRWAADNGARIINLSLGSPEYSDTLQDAIDYASGKGCLLVAAAGNDATNQKNYPAANDRVIAVAATDFEDQQATFSNYGSYIDLAAPGVDIMSTTNNGSYGRLSGTSMATPSVAGIAGLLFSANPNLTPTQVEKILIDTAIDYGTSGWDADFGYGMPNAEAALRKISSVKTLPVPRDLFAVHVKQNQFEVRWSVTDTGNYVTGFAIYLDGMVVDQVARLTQRYVFTDLDDSRWYNVSIRSLNSNGQISEESEVLPVLTLDGTPPTQPSNLQSWDIKADGFRIRWNASEDEIGVSEYFVYLDDELLGKVSSQTYSVTIAELEDFTWYEVRVRAVDEAGNISDFSESMWVRTSDATAPTAPSNLSVRDVTLTGFRFQWSESADNDRVAGYVIYIDGKIYRSVSATETMLVFTGLSPKTSYQLYVLAFDSAGNFSNSSKGLLVSTAADQNSPSRPGKPVATFIGKNEISLTWIPSIDNVKVAGYRLFVDGKQVGERDGFATSGRISGLEEFKSYDMSLLAYDTSGNISEMSDVLRVRTLDATAPTMPSGLVFSTTNGKGYRIQWNASVDNGGAIQYQVFLNGNMVASVNVPYAVLSIPDLGTSLNVTVTARDGSGNTSRTSLPLRIQQQDKQPPTVPTSLSLSSITSNSLIVFWTAAKDNEAIAGYEVFHNRKKISTTKMTRFKFEGLTENAVQTFSVRAIDTSGNLSALSLPVTTVPTIKVVGKKMYANFKPIMFSNTSSPVSMNGQLMVPMKPTLESMGLSVKQDLGTGAVVANKQGFIVKFNVGSKIAIVNGRSKSMVAAPVNVKGVIMAPLLFFANELGYRVSISA